MGDATPDAHLGDELGLAEGTHVAGQHCWAAQQGPWPAGVIGSYLRVDHLLDLREDRGIVLEGTTLPNATLASQAQGRDIWVRGGKWSFPHRAMLPTRIPIGEFQDGVPFSPDLGMTRSTCKAPRDAWKFAVFAVLLTPALGGQMVSLAPIQELGTAVNMSSHDINSMLNTALPHLLCDNEQLRTQSPEAHF